DPQGEDRGAGEAAAREQVVQTEERALPRVRQEVGERIDVHARRGDVRADAVDDEAEEREEQLHLQLRNLEQIGDGRGHSIIPPACSIFVLALAETATPFT